MEEIHAEGHPIWRVPCQVSPVQRKKFAQPSMLTRKHGEQLQREQDRTGDGRHSRLQGGPPWGGGGRKFRLGRVPDCHQTVTHFNHRLREADGDDPAPRSPQRSHCPWQRPCSRTLREPHRRSPSARFPRGSPACILADAPARVMECDVPGRRFQACCRPFSTGAPPVFFCPLAIGKRSSGTCPRRTHFVPQEQPPREKR